MTNLILLSALVSIITLAIYLFNRKIPREMRIPSWFMGSKNQSNPDKLVFTRPPPLIWLFILLATVGFALAYRGPDLRQDSPKQGELGLLWLDNTFSSAVARQENKVNLEEIATEVMKSGLTLYGLSTNFILENRQIVPQYELIPLPTRGDISSYLTDEANKPVSPLSRPIEPAQLTKALHEHERFQTGTAHLMVISDGQRQSIESFVGLSGQFSSATLLQHSLPSSLVGTREELIPKDLLDLWKLETTSGNQDFVPLIEAQSVIPSEARPRIYKETIPLNSRESFSFISAERARQAGLPLLTGCARQTSGPLFLDPFADVRALGQFFRAPFRLDSCNEAGLGTEASRNEDPWKYRTGSLWIVPADDTVFNTLQVRTEFWLPEGFNPAIDALIYVAHAKPLVAEQSLVRSLTQLDEAGFPIPLFLMPPPPVETISFPGGASDLSPSQATEGRFEVIFEAADGTPLGYQAKDLPIFYLRTTAAMPNGELGRASRWTGFWLEAGRKVMPETVGISPVAHATSTSELREKLDANSLMFNEPNASHPLSVGVYRNQDSNKLFVSALPDEERSREFLVPGEFESLLNLSNENPSEGANRNVHASSAQIWGAALAAAALALLWILKPRLATLLVFALIGGTFAKPASAQDTESLLERFRRMQPRGQFNSDLPRGPKTVPFRIAWCDANPPPEIVERYKRMRDTLANRGTIELPNELILGGCTPGAAEVWWTDSPAAFRPAALNEHVSSGGVFILEANESTQMSEALARLADPSIGLSWESPARRGTLYRSFYLLRTFDGCTNDSTLLLTLRKKPNAHSPVGIVTRGRFLTSGSDCFMGQEGDRMKSFVNLWYSILTTDYKEDQLHLPEILNRVKNLGLEP